MKPPSIRDAYGRFSARKDVLDEILAMAEHINAPVGHLSRSDRLRLNSMKFHYLVGLCAAFEDYFKSIVKGFGEECQRRQIQNRNLNGQLLVLMNTRKLQSVSDSGKRRKHAVANELVDYVRSCDRFSMDEYEYPMDAKTIRPADIQWLWETVGLSGASVPTTHMATALNEMANKRNDLAHGSHDSESLGPSINPGDIRAIGNHVQELAEHILIKSEEYFDGRCHLRR